MENKFTVKNISTGFTFVLSKEECDRLVVEEPNNFEVIDKNYVPPVSKKIDETSTYNRVVVGETDEEKAKRLIRQELIDEYAKEGKTWEENSLEKAVQEKLKENQGKEKQLEKLTKAELKALCDEKNIEYANNATNAQLIELLKV